MGNWVQRQGKLDSIGIWHRINLWRMCFFIIKNRELHTWINFNMIKESMILFRFLLSLNFNYDGFQSTGSFFHDKSITLGSLIGLSSILDLSRRSTRGRMSETLKDKKNYKSKTWLFSLCSRLNTDAVCMKDTPSLGHFLEAERRAATGYRRNQSPTIPGPDDFSNALPVPDTNSLFIGDQVAPRSSTPLGSEDGGQSNRDLLEHDNGYGVLFPCLCGQLLKWLAWLNYFLCFFSSWGLDLMFMIMNSISNCIISRDGSLLLE